MMLNVVALYDKLLKVYTRPTFVNTKKSDLAEEYRRMIVPAPEKAFQLKDMEVYFLGTYNDEKALFELLDKPEFIVRLEDFFPSKEVKEDGNKD